jgi:diguanylate cyclase (GGDEF)-like protein
MAEVRGERGRRATIDDPVAAARRLQRFGYRTCRKAAPDMTPAALPAFEAERLASVRSYDQLDAASDAAFDDFAAIAARLTGCPIALVSLVGADRHYFKARIGLDMAETPRDVAFCAHAILAPARFLMVPDTAADARFADHPLVREPPGIRFYAGAALVDAGGHALGALCVLDRQPRELSVAVQESLALLAGPIVATLELRRAARQLREMALTDALTGLANRPAFFGALDRAIAAQRRDGAWFGLVCVDLDGFKTVNDRHGHGAGDAVLLAAARSLLACACAGDAVARIGGDEFAVLLGPGDGRDVALVADRVRRAVRQATAAHGATISASVGAVTFATPPADPVAALIAADRLLYAAKTAGKDRTAHRVVGACLARAS